jgi:ATP-dependent Clp protease ATP-binding subunit ClpC
MAGFDRFTNQVRRLLDSARDEAIRLGQDAIGSEHLLLALLREGQGIAAAALTNLGYELDYILLEVEKSVPVSPTVRFQSSLPLNHHARRALELGVEEARQSDCAYIGTEHILLGILREGESSASQVLLRLGLSVDRARRVISELSSYPEQPGTGTRKKNSALKTFGRNLTELARERKLDPVIGRRPEIDRLFQIFCRRRKNNPVLIGEAGVGKTAIVEGFVQALVSDSVPELLENRQVVMLDLAALVAGTKYRGEFEQRLKAVLEEVAESKSIIFIDELHALIGAGGAEGAMDASHILKPALVSGEFQCIGATTLAEYRKYVEKDAALERRFQSVFVAPPNLSETIEILKGLRPKYQEHHGVKISDAALWSAARLSDRYITGRFLPDKAIDVLDEACAYVRLTRCGKLPSKLKVLEAELKNISESREKAIRGLDYENAIRLRDKERIARLRFQEMKSEWRKGVSATESTVTEHEVAKTVGLWTGIAVQQFSEDEGQRLLKMEAELGRCVIGQKKAVETVSRAIRRSRSGIKDRNRPIGSFLFLGPTGVGKTYLAKILVKFLFGDRDALIQIDMSEYMERFSVSRLIGAPPGYVGYEEGGQLTERVRRQPYSVILLDEFEKAHPDVHNLLLQVLEEGRLTDSFGRRVDFRNTVIILTSNLGTQKLKTGAILGFVSQKEELPEYREMQTLLKLEAEKVFRSEFLNRIDEVVVFKSLSPEDASAIVRLEVGKVMERLKEENLRVDLDEKAYRFLEKEGFDAQLGARPLKRVITKHIEDRLSEELLSGNIHPGDTVLISADSAKKRLNIRVRTTLQKTAVTP